jgi:serine/threonine-protein kinase
VLQRRVAFKVFHRRAGDADVLKNEVAMAAQLGPRFAVRVFDADPAQGWVTMEWVQMGSLRDWVIKRRTDLATPGEEVWPWLLPLARALAALHSHGYVHGDLKPGNILLRHLAEPVLSDFGLARREGEEQAGGSAAYLSPERIAGAATNFADDIYGFGRVLEEALTAHGATSAKWIQQVSAVATGCLAKKTERIPSARKLVELLART